MTPEFQTEQYHIQLSPTQEKRLVDALIEQARVKTGVEAIESPMWSAPATTWEEYFKACAAHGIKGEQGPEGVKP